MSAVLKLDQGSPDWHKHRAAHANASEAPTIMGVSPWEPDTWFKLWQMKSGRAALSKALPPFLQRGLDMEDEARAAYEKSTGNIMQPVVMGKWGWISASLDGVSFYGDTLLEIKCPAEGEDSKAWQETLAGALPEHYYWQVQHQLYVSGAQVAHLWLFDGDDGLLTEVLPDRKNQGRLLHAWRKFWTYLVTDTPPPLIEKDSLVREDEAWGAAAGAYRLAKGELQQAEHRAEKARQKLIGLARHPKVTGAGVTVSKYWQEGRVNYAAIPELQTPNLDRYRGPETEHVRVTVGENV